MLNSSLNSWLMFEHAASHFPDTEIVTQLSPQLRHRYTYLDFSRRAQQLMHALDQLGVGAQEPVATLAWNSYRHLECYFGVPCSGRILHPLNPRLPSGDLEFIIQDAGDRVILVDESLLPVLERVRAALGRVRHIVVLSDRAPESELGPLSSYEELIAAQPSNYRRLDIPEQTVLGIGYTSGTTGRPKGVRYTHRSTYLHALTSTSGAAMGLGPQDCMLPVVPMFHVNAWGSPFAATMVGAKQVFTGPNLDPGTIVSLLEEEEVTVTEGVPTIWAAVAEELARRGSRLPALRFATVGGAQPPLWLIERFEREFGITILQGWGMTETSPVAAIAWPKHKMRRWDPELVRREVRAKAGLPLPGIDVRVVDEAGVDLPFDGTSRGELLVRGPWVVDSYLGGGSPECFTAEGWFRTGDIATISPEGYFTIVDRTRDLIKSGGEWISSVDMEGDLAGMPAVLEAAVFAVPDPRWQERPMVAAVVRPGQQLTLALVHAHLLSLGWQGWQLPDRLELVTSVPKTSVGKFDKKALRAMYGAPAMGGS